jgi:hypothetical protein
MACYTKRCLTHGVVQKRQQILIINGNEKNTTQNLHKTLQHLRLLNQDQILWVDAICINQDSHKERGHQVQQMHHIYGSADRVLVWLGLGTLATNLVMNFMNVQHKIIVQVGGSQKHLADSLLLKTGLERLLGH